MLDTKENLKGKIDDAADKAKGWTQGVGDTARATAKGSEGSTAGGVVEAVQDVAAGASELFIQGKDTAQEWAAAAAGAAGQVKDKAVELASTAADRVGDLGQDVTRLIRRYPLQALLIGFGVGFGIGFLLTRGTRHS
jgi:ElaB/YqjD/DUF883 family membrane-anchored ribosome-binding protein